MNNSSLEQPLVSIITPCYNGAKYLAEALDSVFAQTYKNWECIIVDDGSKDNSKQIALSYTAKDKRFQYIYQANKGTSAARNKAIAESKGRYLMPLDADDKISPGYIEKAVAILHGSNDIKLVYCKARMFGRVDGPWNLRPYSLKEMLIENMLFCTALFRREDFDKTQGFSEDMKGGFEDWDFWLSFLNETDKVYQIPEVLFYYRIAEKSRNPVSDEKMQRELRHKMYNRHKALFDKFFEIPDLLFEYNALRNKYTHLQDAYNEAFNSATFKIGKIILKPYWFIKNIFN